MGALIVLVLIVVVAVAAVAAGVARAQRAQERSVAAAEAAEARADGSAGGPGALRYHVPDGQDPVAVVAALSAAGIDATYEARSDLADILITTPAGADRERARVRAAIEQAPIDMEGHSMPPHEVRFADEGTS